MHLFSLYCIPFLLVSIFSCMFSHNPYQVISTIERCVSVNGYDVCLMKHSDSFFSCLYSHRLTFSHMSYFCSCSLDTRYNTLSESTLKSSLKLQGQSSSIFPITPTLQLFGNHLDLEVCTGRGDSFSSSWTPLWMPIYAKKKFLYF